MKPTCPLLGKPCIEEKCAAWASDTYEENGKQKIKAACVQFYWTPLYLRTIACRTDGTQQAVEGMRNEIHTGNEVFNLLAHRSQEQRLLKGGDNGG